MIDIFFHGAERPSKPGAGEQTEGQNDLCPNEDSQGTKFFRLVDRSTRFSAAKIRIARDDTKAALPVHREAHASQAAPMKRAPPVTRIIFNPWRSGKWML
ncbi:hypothetical protein [Rhizobium phaseoli]|uniref:hypothetical protein n=1 Tax=Rhizobium phaseoli TaxID=396 RepID=UPI0011AE9F90|nr:hypothetical protein [Rhizobium phaseoli]